MADDFKLTFQGQEFATGLIKPDTIPLSFAAYPPEQVLDLADIKRIYAAKGRKPVRELYKRRKQQGRKSSCCAYAATTACEVKRLFDRKEDKEFGPEYLYCNINGGRDAGALLDVAMKSLLTKGCCLRETVPYQIHAFKGNMSMEEKRFADQEAEDFKALDWIKMPHGNVDACWAATVSSIAQRDPVLMAVHCGNNFFGCGKDGNCRADRGVGNHAVCGADLVGVESARSLRDIKIWTINSHGARFGDNGCYLHTIDHMNQPCQYHQHCAAQAMRTSPDEKISTLLN